MARPGLSLAAMGIFLTDDFLELASSHELCASGEQKIHKQKE
jgi:hypothetical protein